MKTSRRHSATNDGERSRSHTEPATTDTVSHEDHQHSLPIGQVKPEGTDPAGNISQQAHKAGKPWRECSSTEKWTVWLTGLAALFALGLLLYTRVQINDFEDSSHRES